VNFRRREGQEQNKGKSRKVAGIRRSWETDKLKWKGRSKREKRGGKIVKIPGFEKKINEIGKKGTNKN